MSVLLSRIQIALLQAGSTAAVTEALSRLLWRRRNALYTRRAGFVLCLSRAQRTAKPGEPRSACVCVCVCVRARACTQPTTVGKAECGVI